MMTVNISMAEWPGRLFTQNSSLPMQKKDYTRQVEDKDAFLHF